MEGTHDLQECFAVTREVLQSVFNELYRQRVMLEGMILKPNMVVSGLSASLQASTAEVTDATIKCLRESVPSAVSAIAFLSGGQSGELASSHLNSMQVKYK